MQRYVMKRGEGFFSLVLIVLIETRSCFVERTGVGIYKINERAVSSFVGIFCGKKRKPSAFCLVYSFFVLDIVQTDTSQCWPLE